MSNNEKFPSLGEESQKQTQQSTGGWGEDVEIPTQKKNKKKLKLPGSNADSGFSFAPAQGAVDFSGGQQQQMDFNFGFQQSSQPFDFSQNQPQLDLTQMLGNQYQEPFYSYPAAFEGLGALVIKDQFGNYFELEENQYLENGQIFEKEPEPVQEQYNNYNNQNQYNNNKFNQNQKPQQNQKQQQVKKETKKKEAKPAQPIKPKVYKRELKAMQQTDEQKQQELMGVVKKQERFTIKQLQEKEQQLISQLGDKYYRVNAEKEQINLVFIGHVDAGKSTLCGRVLVDAKEIDEKTLSQFEQEAKAQNREGWFFAYAMDISEDERSKGKTVETGKAFFELNDRRFTLLDAPGHKNYVPNMIAGACQSDMACLIISSKPGEFESGFEKGGQTTEHVQLIKALGVSELCCVVSKMDTNDWSEERFKHIEGIMKPWLATTGGFSNVTFIPIDALGGQNVSGTVDPGICKWYNGPYLFQHLNKVGIPKRDPRVGVKIPILDVQKEEGKVFIYGKVESGTIFEDIYVTTMSNRRTFQIQEIYDAKDRRIYYAPAGENIKFKVKGIEADDLQRGYIVCSTDDLCGVALELQAEIQILDMPQNKSIMSNGYKCIIHMHTTVQEVTIDEVMAIYDKNHSKFVKSSFLKSGDKGVVKISCEKYLCLEKYSDIPFLGRFTIRDENSTIGYGTIRKYKPAFEFQRIMLKNKEQEKKN